MLARPALLNPAEAFFKPDQLWHPISGGEISDRRRSLVRWFVDEETHLTPTYKTTTLMEVMKDFLRYCIRYRPVYQVSCGIYLCLRLCYVVKKITYHSQTCMYILNDWGNI